MTAPTTTRKELPAGTVCKVLEAAGETVPEKARDGSKAIMRCIFPDAHKHGDRDRSAYVDPGRNLYGCATCGSFSAKKLAEALNVSWGAILADVLPREGRPPRQVTPGLTADEVTAAWEAGLAFTRLLLDNRQEDAALAHLAERRLAPALVAEEGREPLAVIWPPDGAGLPDRYARLAQDGYRIAARLYDVRTAALADLQAHFAGDEPLNLRPKILSPIGGRVAGCAYLNGPALELVCGKEQTPPRVVLGEGLTDYLALSLALPDDRVACVAGASNVRGVLGENGTRPAWLREGLSIVDALDLDAAGEKASAHLLTLARAARVKVCRVRWPDGCKDAADVFQTHGAEGLAHAVNGAREKVTRLVEIAEPLPAFLARDFPKPKSLIGEALVCAGEWVLCYGPPDVGKSWLALTFLLSLASGRGCFNLAGPEKPLRVGFLSMELPGPQLQERIRRLMDRLELAAPPETFWPIARPRLRGPVNLVEPEHQKELLDFCGELRLDLAWLDPFSRIHRADANKEPELAPVLDGMEEVRLATGTALVVNHHVRKETGRGRASAFPSIKSGVNVLDEIRNSSRLQSDPTTIFRLIPFRGVYELGVAKANFAAKPAPIYLRRGKDGPFEVTNQPTGSTEGKEERLALMREAVLGAGARGMTPAEVVKLLNAAEHPAAERTVRAYAAELDAAGDIRRQGEGPATRYFPRDESGKS